MASAPKRRWSKDIPPDLSELMNTLIKYANSFIREFDNKERDMTRIVGEFKKIAAEVREEMEKINKRRNIAAAAAAVGVIAALFNGGLSLVVTAAVGGGGAGVLVLSTAIIKTMIKNGSATKVENLGKEFTRIVEPLKNDLEQIQTTCEKLEQESSEVRAKHSLEEMEEFEKIIRRVSELGEKIEEGLSVAVILIQCIGNMVTLVTEVLKAAVTTKVEEEFIDSVIKSSERCQKVVHEFETMKKELRKSS